VYAVFEGTPLHRLLKIVFRGVIPSEAKDVLSARAESKADPKRNIDATSRMTLM